MNEQLFFDIGQQKHVETIARAERNLAQQTVNEIGSRSTRDRLALGLVTLAAKLQPSITIQVQHPAKPAVA